MNEEKSSNFDHFQRVVKELAVRGLMTNDCHFLDIIVKAFVLLDIKSDQTVDICRKLDLIGRQLELKSTNQAIDDSIDELKANIRLVEDKINDSIVVSKSNSAFESKIAEKIRFYSDKAKEYYSSVKSRENNLMKLGFTTDLRQKSIESLREETHRLRARLNETTDKLSQFKDFSPSEAELMKRISEMRAELNGLDYKYFNDKL